jgi:hypothetical protein
MPISFRIFGGSPRLHAGVRLSKPRGNVTLFCCGFSRGLLRFACDDLGFLKGEQQRRATLCLTQPKKPSAKARKKRTFAIDARIKIRAPRNQAKGLNRKLVINMLQPTGHPHQMTGRRSRMSHVVSIATEVLYRLTTITRLNLQGRTIESRMDLIKTNSCERKMQ